MDKPPYLYKYYSAARAAQIIRDLAFYFAPVAKLNDLYEFRVRSLYRETQESRKRVFAKQLVNQGWFDTTEEAIESIDTPELIASADSAYSYFLETLNGQLAAIMQHSGVTCFSAHRNNQRMWGTYGDAHAGAVIEFTTSSEASSFADHLMPILYAADKPDLCPSEFLTADLKLDQWLCGALCCIKHYHWRDEAEWRLLLLANSAQTDKDRIVPFERTAITRVFVGPRISDGNERLIREAAGSKSSPIGVFKRDIDKYEAKEELVGAELITSLDQLLYWGDRAGRR